MTSDESVTGVCSLRDLLRYFLRLGTFGFGGPIALAGHMQRDLVEGRRWFSKEDYAQGLALAQLAPGPLAAQLAMYLGWVRAGSLGATLVAVAFILPSFAMVLGLSMLYVHFGGLSWIQGAFYGIGAAVIAVIARSAFKLARATVARDWLLWVILGTNAVLTAWTEREVVWVFALSGVASLLLRAPPRGSTALAAVQHFSAPGWLFQGLHGVASWSVLARIGAYFGEAGVFVFGSGLAIVPFLHGGVVGQYHWLNDRQFLDAVAVAMITPGPVVITVAFIGFLVAGLGGALAAALGVLPALLPAGPAVGTALSALRRESIAEGVRERRDRGSVRRHRRGCRRTGPPGHYRRADDHDLRRRPRLADRRQEAARAGADSGGGGGRSRMEGVSTRMRESTKRRVPR